MYSKLLLIHKCEIYQSPEAMSSTWEHIFKDLTSYTSGLSSNIPCIYLVAKATSAQVW